MLRLTPPAAGQTQWSKTVLYRFKRYGDGVYPEAGLIFDKNGALYGTMSGLALSWGTAFKLTPPAAGKTQWTETVLYSFKGPPYQDGAWPVAGLILDPTGALCGTTSYGGASDNGTVFKLTGAAPAAAVPEAEEEE